ncbi:type II toxin-antitoxin system Phd/YefM family antitoxin [Terrimicrobium sacchariphilum]|uniref:type II toxin-antitoxin system Phd/YefM family antitoxin n=1 Tax=Terrimicrobium sacchariphilum TaxID=690879 RepID=UPI001471E1AC
MTTISVEELQAHTSDIVRRVVKSSQPIAITDSGEVVAIHTATPNISHSRSRQRTLLPEYAELMASPPTSDVIADLNATRGDR